MPDLFTFKVGERRYRFGCRFGLLEGRKAFRSAEWFWWDISDDCLPVEMLGGHSGIASVSSYFGAGFDFFDVDLDVFF